MDQMLNILINNGVGVACAALVLWMAWYRETRTMPSLITTFNEANMRSIQSLRDTQELLQRSFAERNAKSLEAFANLVREERSLYQKWHEENLTRLEKITLDQKEQRHYLLNLSHQLKLNEAVEKEMRREKPPA